MLHVSDSDNDGYEMHAACAHAYTCTGKKDGDAVHTRTHTLADKNDGHGVRHDILVRHILVRFRKRRAFTLTRMMDLQATGRETFAPAARCGGTRARCAVTEVSFIASFLACIKILLKYI